MVRAAAIAEEAIGLGIGVEVEGFDLGDTGGEEAVADITGQVEVRPAGRAVGEEAAVALRLNEEAGAESVVYFVGGLGNAWADGCRNAVSRGAEPLHCGDRGIRHSAERA